ncbi:hypothetical protein EJ08DRAFT_588775 [Tothia fuscella]|uniref:Box C/D snoRNA protein 1 n=1 Tax=Tothia fuscella TaxID=1048955 RepID=A0A9P4NR16_9PEZI|nr:hypothetical protein EJ08DRAFT_588775 [Tothia fuscella]
MTDQPLLSNLCSICHINTPKYRCPGCSTQTCSLQCVQRHKEWAQCTGKRDPTAYVRKSKLTTPAGIDHDYNFITGIERSREDAEKGLQERTIIHSGPDAARSVRELRARIDARIHATQVRVEKAPKGLSREKLNKTRITKSRRLCWTVEWIHEDRRTDIGQSIDTDPLSHEYSPFFKKLHGLETVQNKKRKWKKSTLQTSSSPTQKLTKEPLNATSQAGATTATSLGPIVIKEPGAADDNGNHFYLVKPHTSGTQKVLIPLSPTDCLFTCLRNQTVLEFPTIQVLPQSPEELPSTFILENDYLAKSKAEQEEMQRLVDEAGELKTLGGAEEVVEGRQSMPNAQDILAILKRDVVSG